jgi:hypothetical protein
MRSGGTLAFLLQKSMRNAHSARATKTKGWKARWSGPEKRRANDHHSGSNHACERNQINENDGDSTIGIALCRNDLQRIVSALNEFCCRIQTLVVY